jgi:Asp-tRNA(Asn)/Glu-tRNA(Gln) amidotransferase A subunit family amidase
MSGDLAFAGVTGQREALRAGAVSSAELVESALARIETYDAALGSFRTVLPKQARRAAAAADRERAGGADRPLGHRAPHPPGGPTRRTHTRRGAALAARLTPFFDRFDLLVTPVLGMAPRPIGAYSGRAAMPTLLAMTRYLPFTVPWNVIGQPAVCLPAGRDPQGAPVAVQLVGRSFDDATALAVAAQLEAATGWAALVPNLEVLAS